MQILISGTDTRLIYLMELLKRKYSSVTYAAGQEEEERWLSAVRESKESDDFYYIGGKIPKQKKAALESQGVAFFDTMLDPDMKEYNAIATAEGAISQAIMLSPWNLSGANMLVLGYGCCGKAIAERGRAWGAEVVVAARGEAAQKLILANHFNGITLEKISSHIGEQLYIMNTIPALILDAPLLGAVRKDAVILDIASAPGGVDYETAKELGLTAKLSLAIPGRLAPRSSARKLFEIFERHTRIESDKKK